MPQIEQFYPQQKSKVRQWWWRFWQWWWRWRWWWQWSLWWVTGPTTIYIAPTPQGQVGRPNRTLLPTRLTLVCYRRAHQPRVAWVWRMSFNLHNGKGIPVLALTITRTCEPKNPNFSENYYYKFIFAKFKWCDYKVYCNEMLVWN